MWSLFANVVVIATLPLCAVAQGFDWVPSYLLPFRIPTAYGIAGMQFDAVSLYDSQAITDGALVCATYGDGSGMQPKLNVGGEWWVMPDATVMVLANVGWLRVTHRAAGTTAPLVTGEILRTEYVLSTSRVSVGVQAAAKKRLHWRYSWIKAGLDVCAYLPPLLEQSEHVLEPGWYTFSTTPPSRQVNIATSTSNRIDVQVSLVLALGYDLPIRYGVYVLPSLEAALPLTLKAGSFRLWRIGISIPVAFSLH